LKNRKILTWYNEKTNIDMALSFQHQEGADDVWKKIFEVQTGTKGVFGPWVHPFSNKEHEMRSLDEYEDSESEFFVADPGLLVPDYSNLDKFEQFLVGQSNSLEKRNQISNLLAHRKLYLEKLFEIFQNAEKDRNHEKLLHLYKIFRQMITMANYDLFTVLMSDEYYLNVFGILEYDPDMYNKQKITHRQYFLDHAAFKVVVNIKDQDILRLIHFNFRLMYLRDCALAHYLDDRCIQLISAIIHANYIDIIKHLHSSKEVISSLFDALRSNKSNALRMIHEILTTIKNLDIDKAQIIETFSEYNLFETLEDIMKNQQQSTILPNKILKKKDKTNKEACDWDLDFNQILNTILEILIMCVVHAPIYLKKYSTSERQKILKYPFLNFVIDNIVSNNEISSQNLFGELMKHLIDTDLDEENEVQDIFYDQLLAKMLKVFDDDTSTEKSINSKNVVCDIIMFCAKQQMKRIKEPATNLDLVNKVFKVFSTNNKFLILMAIQIFKLFLLAKDEVLSKTLLPSLSMIIQHFTTACKKKKEPHLLCYFRRLNHNRERRPYRFSKLHF